MIPPNPTESLQQMEIWVQQYKDDDPPHRLAQTAAIQAMDHMLKAWQHGLDGVAIKAALSETQRMLQILNAFQGKIAILDCMVNGIPEDDDD